MLQKNTSSLDYVFLWVMQSPYSKNPVLNGKEVYFNFLTCLAVYCTDVSPFGYLQRTSFKKF